MKTNEVIEIVRRGNKSKIASDIKDFEFDNLISKVTVSQNAPCCIKNDGCYPKQLGWVEIEGEMKHAGNPYSFSEIWIKTATLGGRNRKWVRSSN
jgi:hypothetical protein